MSFAELDIRHLRKHGLLRPGATGSMRQTYGGRVLHTIETKAEDDEVLAVVDGRLFVLDLEYTPQPFGGRRAWFSCPNCGGRAAVLYGTPFACRPCHRIAYPSQRATTHHRAIMKAQKYRMRLGGNGNLAEPFPDRPWGMWDRTYQRIRRRAGEADSALLGHGSLLLDRLRRRAGAG